MPKVSAVEPGLKSVEDRLRMLEARQPAGLSTSSRGQDSSSDWQHLVRDDRINPNTLQLRMLESRVDSLDSGDVQWREEWQPQSGTGSLVVPSTFFAQAPAVERFHETNLRRGEWMSTNVIISQSGRVDGIDRTWCNNELNGFTGGRGVLYTDGAGNVLAQTPVTSYGVDGKWIWWSQSDRTVPWTTQLPADVAGSVQGIQIFHFPTPRNRLPEIIQQIVNAINVVIDAVIAVGGTIRDALERLCRELPELCAIFRAAFGG